MSPSHKYLTYFPIANHAFSLQVEDPNDRPSRSRITPDPILEDEEPDPGFHGGIYQTLQFTGPSGITLTRTIMRPGAANPRSPSTRTSGVAGPSEPPADASINMIETLQQMLASIMGDPTAERAGPGAPPIGGDHTPAEPRQPRHSVFIGTGRFPYDDAAQMPMPPRRTAHTHVEDLPTYCPPPPNSRGCV